MMAWLLLAAVMAAQVPTFGSRVNVVGVTVTAVDERTGAPVVDLTIDDFIVTEDLKVREIIHYGQHDVPASVLLMMDASSSVRPYVPAIRAAAARLIRSLRPADEVQVVQFAAHYQELNDFTTDHEDAIAGLSRGLVNDDRTVLNRALLIAAGTLSKRSGGDAERRRVIVLLSDGQNTGSSFSQASVLERIKDSGVLVYVVFLEHRGTSTQDPAQVMDARQFMERIVFESGGRIAIVPVPYETPRKLVRAFGSIGDELGMQYHLAFESAADVPGWHNIGVMLRSRSGVSLRYRRGYYLSHRR